MARIAPEQARDPRALSRPRLSRRRHVRRASGVRVLLRQVGARPHPTGGRDDRRPVQGADEIRAAHQPAGGPRARQRRAQQHGGRRLPLGRADLRGAAQPRHARRSAARGEPRLVSRLGFQRDQGARGRRSLRRRAGADRAPRARPQHPAPRRGDDREPVAPVRSGLPRQAGGHRDPRPHGRGAHHRRRARLRWKPVQPRDGRAASARLLVQALRLSHRADERALPPANDHQRRAPVHRQLLPA